MSSFGERLKARRRMQEQSYRTMKRVRQKNMRVMNQLDCQCRLLDNERKIKTHSLQKEKEILEDSIQNYKKERKVVQRNILMLPVEESDYVIRSTEDIRLLKRSLLRLVQDVDNEDVNIKKFKKLPRGAFLPKISLDPQVPLKLIDRDMKDLRRFNHVELRDKLLVSRFRTAQNARQLHSSLQERYQSYHVDSYGTSSSSEGRRNPRNRNQECYTTPFGRNRVFDHSNS
ncbi:hypothetical protein ACHWQZ_G011869 [Mnemiopsis leidyi]